MGIKTTKYNVRMVVFVLETVQIMDPSHGNVVMKKEDESDAHQIIQTCAQPRMYVVMEQLYVVKKIVVIWTVNLAVNYHVLNLMKMSARKSMMKSTMRMMLWMATMMTMIWRKKLLWRKKTLQNNF